MSAAARVDLLSFDTCYQAPKKLVRLTGPLEHFNSRMTRQKCLEDLILKNKSLLGTEEREKRKKKNNEEVNRAEAQLVKQSHNLKQ